MVHAGSKVDEQVVVLMAADRYGRGCCQRYGMIRGELDAVIMNMRVILMKGQSMPHIHNLLRRRHDCC
jgi:hypothetical protein